VPLVLLVWIAWSQTEKTTGEVNRIIQGLVFSADNAIVQVGDMTIKESIDVLDEQATEELERIATDTAGRIAEFLSGRDADILMAAHHVPDAVAYQVLITNKYRHLVRHGQWRLNADQSGWEPWESENTALSELASVEPGSRDIDNSFHHHPPAVFNSERQPLYLEMTFVGLDGKELIKVTSSDRISPEPKDVSQRHNTYAHAEIYFPELKKLKPGEIYVSDVIGTYVGSRFVGSFTPAAAEKHGIAFEPEKHGYSGAENPVGKRFQGIVRWAAPVARNSQITGWVTLALNHDHLMSFTDTIAPTKERYRDIGDGRSGNYAFIWDYKGRSIVHPHHYSIVGYDENGEPAVPFLESRVFEDWQKSGKSWRDYMETAPTFVDQRLSKEPERSLAATDNIGLDCRYLNFLPQCVGWYKLTGGGGSGSFFSTWNLPPWIGQSRLSAAAAIPYYTGQYSPEAQGNRRGFGYVVVSAGADEIHKGADNSKIRQSNLVMDVENEMNAQGLQAEKTLYNNVKDMTTTLVFSTLALVVFVIFIALWLASYLSRQIGWLNNGCNNFRLGKRDFRFNYKYDDEFTSLAGAFNEMADTVNEHVLKLEGEIEERKRAENDLREIRDNLEILVEKRTHELSEEVEFRRIAEEKARYLARHDPLTGLANRMLFDEELDRAINQSARSKKHGALLFFDLDRFKQVNDSLGHAVGDALLIHMANVLQKRVRKTDTPARLGGDEFAVIATELESPESVATLAQSILDNLRELVTLLGHEMHVRSSIGIATFQGDAIEAAEIVRRADAAMYMSKTEGGMCYQFFESALQEKPDKPQ
jgi:diguanylate cyclase (GGDEF)-like protein